MIATQHELQTNVDSLCKAAIDNCEPVIVARENGENVVIISLSEYENMLENSYVRKSKANYDRLLESIEQAKSGQLISFNPETEEFNE